MTQPPAFTPQDFKDALDVMPDTDNFLHTIGNWTCSHYETIRTALTECAKRCGDAEIDLRELDKELAFYESNAAKISKYPISLGLKTLIQAAKLYRTQKGETK